MLSSRFELSSQTKWCITSHISTLNFVHKIKRAQDSNLRRYRAVILSKNRNRMKLRKWGVHSILEIISCAVWLPPFRYLLSPEEFTLSLKLHRALLGFHPITTTFKRVRELRCTFTHHCVRCIRCFLPVLVRRRTTKIMLGVYSWSARGCSRHATLHT